MINDEIEKLAAVLESGLGRNIAPEGSALFRRLVLLLAEGQPVSPSRVSTVGGQPHEEVMAMLHRLPGIEWDESGNIVGAGLTLRPTPHQFKRNDRTLFTWCALDTLMFPALIGQTVQVESPCASTGVPVRMTVTSEGVEQVEPVGAVVSLVTPEDVPDVRRVFCDYVNFFRSTEATSVWLAEHPGATTLPVAEAYQLGRRLAEVVL